MSEIFLSYATPDRATAETIAKALKAQGWAVWWDRKISPGRKYEDVIHAALSEAKCVVVLWSEHSVASDWVKEEAEEGKKRGILVPVVIGEAPVPLGFRRVEAAHLVGWQGSLDDPEFQEFRRSVARLVQTGTFHVRDAEGNEWGPITQSELRAWIEQRRVSAEMFVRQGEQGKWRLVGDVPSLSALIPKAMPAPRPKAPPLAPRSTAPSPPKVPGRPTATKSPPPLPKPDRSSDPPTHTAHTPTKGGFWLTGGSCGLAVQFWLFGVVVVFVASLCLVFLLDKLRLNTVEWTSLENIISLLYLVYVVLWTVGIWRATQTRPKPDYWGALAKIIAVLWIVMAFTSWSQS